MEQFRNIDEVYQWYPSLANKNMEIKTDRVLRSTKIEQAIYDELSSESDVLDSYTEQGAVKLKSFASLVNDIFQSVYGLRPRYTNENDMTALSKEFNRNILNEVMNDENYPAIKSICEGKELPAIGAAEEFSAQLVERLDSLLEKTTGGKGKADMLNKMEDDSKNLSDKLSELIDKYISAPESQKESMERKVVNTANRIESKQEQIQLYASLIRSNMSRNRTDIKEVVTVSANAALERSKEIQCTLLAWGDGDSEMKRNPLNTDILKRTAKSQKLRYIAKFLGRYKELLKSKRLSGYSHGKGEKYDIEYGNNINHILTSELTMLSTPDLIPLFLRKYQSKALKQYRKREPEYRGSGDIIVCLDESASTFGENNAYGMSIAMLLYELCRINHTNFAVVHFSSKTRVDFFSKDETVPPERLLDCAETFLGGGTNFEKPLKEAITLTLYEKLNKPDIVFITDGVCDMSDEFLDNFEKFKSDTGTRLTGILLDKGSCFDFILQRFSDSIYRTSELVEDDIAAKLIDERIK